MKKGLTSILVLLSLSFGLSSCKQNLESEEIYSTANISANIDTNVTRSQNSQWLTGDVIGVYAISDNLNFRNVGYQCNHDTHFTSVNDKIYFKYDQQDLAFTAYYPYVSNDEITNDTVSINTKVQTSGSANHVNESLNIMYAPRVTANNHQSTVNLTFEHKMARVVLTFAADEGISYDDLVASTTNYYTSNVKHRGTFNVTTGETKLNDNAQAASDIRIDAPATKNGTTTSYALFFIPQNLDVINLRVNINGKDYLVDLDIPENGGTKTLQASKSYNFSIKVNNADMHVDRQGVTNIGSSIEQWTPGNLRTDYLT